MRFDIYGRFIIEVVWEKDGWVVRRVEQGRRMVLPDLIIPPDLPPEQIPRWLEDLFHEDASPSRKIRLLE